MTEISIRFADNTVSQETASAVLDALKEKKTSKIAAMEPNIKVVKAEREENEIVLDVQNEKREAVISVSATSINNGIKSKNINKKVVPVFKDQFDSIDVDKFAEVVVAQANKVIERAARMSKDSVNNPNLKKKQVKAAAKPLF